MSTVIVKRLSKRLHFLKKKKKEPAAPSCCYKPCFWLSEFIFSWPRALKILYIWGRFGITQQVFSTGINNACFSSGFVWVSLGDMHVLMNPSAPTCVRPSGFTNKRGLLSALSRVLMGSCWSAITETTEHDCSLKPKMLYLQHLSVWLQCCLIYFAFFASWTTILKRV